MPERYAKLFSKLQSVLKLFNTNTLHKLVPEAGLEPARPVMDPGF